MNAALVDTIPFPCFITSSDDDMLFRNEMFARYVYDQPIQHKKIKDLFDGWEELRGGGFIHASYKGTTCIFIKAPMGENSLYIGTVSSELLSLMDELKEAKRVNRELDTIIKNSYDGIYITNKEGTTLKTNSAIERITGIPKDDYIGKKVDDLMKRGILENSVTHKVLEKKRSVSVVQKNFSGRETLLTGNPVFNEIGEIDGIVTNSRDLSEMNELQTALRRVAELNNSCKRDLERLKGDENKSEKVVIRSDQLKRIYETADRVLEVDATLLILGETGVGKDVLANYIYNKSERSNTGKLIKVNCGAIPPDLLESELFGYEGGAFTGANVKGKQGMFELAHKGVLFLDEVGELPINLQVKLLRAIQEREIQRVGGTKSKKVDVRIIAATNRNLKEMVKEGRFREDLFYRLNVVPISIPPLRERKCDILPLVELFLKNMNKKYKKTKRFDKDLKEFFYHYSWPGNVREVANLIERMVLVNEKSVLGIDHLPEEYQTTLKNVPPISQALTLKQAVELAEENLLKRAVQKYKTTYEIAMALDTSQPTIVRKLKKYKLTIKDE